MIYKDSKASFENGEKIVAELKVGQWWSDGDRHFKITKLEKHTVAYIEPGKGKDVYFGVTSRIQWEFDVERGKLKEGIS